MPLKPETVLVVDDDAAVRDSLKFALELEGMDVRVHGSGKALLAEADRPRQGAWWWITGCRR